MTVTHLRITAQDDIPVDVLVEHIGHHLRADFKESGWFNVEVTGPRAYAQRYFPQENPYEQ